MVHHATMMNPHVAWSPTDKWASDTQPLMYLFSTELQPLASTRASSVQQARVDKHPAAPWLSNYEVLLFPHPISAAALHSCQAQAKTRSRVKQSRLFTFSVAVQDIISLIALSHTLSLRDLHLFYYDTAEPRHDLGRTPSLSRCWQQWCEDWSAATMDRFKGQEADEIICLHYPTGREDHQGRLPRRQRQV